MTNAIGWMGQTFPVYDGSGDQWDVKERIFTWGSGADELLRVARTRLRPWNRWAETAQRWWNREAQHWPLAVRLLLYLGTLAIGVFVGKLWR